MVRVHGTCDARFARVREAFERNFTERGDVGASFAMTEPGSIAERTIGGTVVDPADTKTAAWRRAEMPAANGHGNARGIVRIQTLLANHGTAWGKTLMSPEGCESLEG